MKLQLLKISRGPGGWIGSVRGKTVNRLHQVNKAAVSLVKASPASLVKCFIFFIRSQILIEVRTWCLLSSQKCSSQFIDIRNCYIYFSESVLLNYFLPTFVVCFDSPHLRRLKKNLSTTNVEKKIQQIQMRKIEITISYGNGMSWTFLWR